ncbi:unnamed protein product (macronuclear) [Paramecium tetraurelia]|uniref:Transmembrane protein n=1 Tax=Paramecium tetraurelia TaxID=5888 RepID=A0EHN7_PARTE|nr:uncharacterized protein GSPATT00027154001 [Paramecium tetraurelia]CAK94828.1 unnamed protein product [Paramecium tetraurelia]|eukprot:XP_001462201.1 hypothetical protein (macronuclear) [Paramecium tetraurelia strain d4-2]
MLQTLFIFILLFLLLTFIGLYLRKYFRNKPLTVQNQGSGQIFSEQRVTFCEQVVKQNSQEISNQKQNIKIKTSKTTATVTKNTKCKPSKIKQQDLEAAFQFDGDSENEKENDSMKNSTLTEKQQQSNSKDQEGFNFQQTSHNLQELVTPTQGMCQEV